MIELYRLNQIRQAKTLHDAIPDVLNNALQYILFYFNYKMKFTY